MVIYDWYGIQLLVKQKKGCPICIIKGISRLEQVKKPSVAVVNGVRVKSYALLNQARLCKRSLNTILFLKENIIKIL